MQVLSELKIQLNTSYKSGFLFSITLDFKVTIHLHAKSFAISYKFQKDLSNTVLNISCMLFFFFKNTFYTYF